jgi:hypothetical protein
MKINGQYSLNEIKLNGLVEKEIKEFDVKIFTSEQESKVYFFENIGNSLFRLYTVISKRSFFL